MAVLQSFIAEHGAPLAIDVGDHLFRQDDRDARLFLIQSGLLKAYYLRPDGREHVKSFVPAGAVIGSMVALNGGGACTFSLQALDRCAVVALPFSRLSDAARGDIALANDLVDFLANYGQRKEQREYEFLCLPAETRYRRALGQLGDIVNRISQADLAAYIGITPPALSRLKRRLAATASLSVRERL